MAMDADIQKEVEYLLDDQLPNIRAAFEEAIKAVCADPVLWLFNLELLDSREVAIDLLGEGLREELKSPRAPDVIPSCVMATERQAAIDTLAARLRRSGVASMVGAPQAPQTIRVLVCYGSDLAVFDVPRRGEW
jgi:hypothetical protein